MANKGGRKLKIKSEWDKLLCNLPAHLHYAQSGPSNLENDQVQQAYNLLLSPACPNLFAPGESTSNGHNADEGPIVIEDSEDDNGEPKSKAASGKKTAKKDKDKDACSADKCSNNPRCLNWLGQDKWETPGALRLFKKNAGLGTSPSNEKDEDTPVGLRNLGATCYMNSFLQVWYRDIPFRAGVYACELPNGAKEDSPLFQLQVLFAHLQCGNLAVYDPTPLVASLKLEAGVQQDAQEFSKLFMDLLNHEFKKQRDDIVGQGGLGVSKLVEQQFEGLVTYGTRCRKCKNSSERQSSFKEWEVNLKKKCSLKECMEKSLESEKLEGDNQYFCDNCNQKRDAQRYVRIDALPPVFHISLMRFIFDMEAMTRKKSQDMITYPLSIDMGQFLTGPASTSSNAHHEQVWYDLKGVLMHKGTSAHHGHYVAQVYDGAQGKWFLYDDESVTPVDNLNAPTIHDQEKEDDNSGGKGKGKGKKKASEDDEDDDWDKPATKRKKANDETAKPVKDNTPKSRDAYMLVYTRRTPTSPVPPGAKAPTSAGADADKKGREAVPAPSDMVMEQLRELALAHKAEVEIYQAREGAVKGDFQAARERKRTIYQSWQVEIDEDDLDAEVDGYLINKVALRRFVEDGLIKPKTSKGKDKDDGSVVTLEPVSIEEKEDGTRTMTLNNTGFLCEHLCLPFGKPDSYKLVSKDTIGRLKELGVTCDFELPVQSGLCKDCVWDKVAEHLYTKTHDEQMETYRELDAVLDGDDHTTYISRRWLNDWKRTKYAGLVDGRGPEPGDDKYLADILCEHGKLSAQSKERITVSSEVAAFLQSIFDDWTPVAKAGKRECDLCKKAFAKERQRAHDEGQAKSKEKREFRNLGGQQLLGGGSLIKYTDGDYFLVTRKFVAQWGEWQRGRAERPQAIVNEQLLCPHGDLCVDLPREIEKPHLVQAIPESDWAKMKKMYNVDHEIKVITDRKNCISQPPICGVCVEEMRRDFQETELKIKRLPKNSIDAKGNRKQQAPESPTMERNPSSSGVNTTTFYASSSGASGHRQSKRIQNAQDGPGKKEIMSLQSITMSKGDSIKDLKVKISAMTNIPTIYQRLWYKGVELASDDTVAALGICGGDVLELYGVDVEDEDFSLFDNDHPNGNGRSEGFGGTNLFGFENSASPHPAQPVAGPSGATPDVDDPAASDTDSGVEVVMQDALADSDLEKTKNCPHCTFKQLAFMRKCEMCDGLI